jgi:hypothetical protein
VTTKGGLTADAYFEIPQEEGGNMIVTLEATSFHKAKEIVYQTKYYKLNWDAFTVASIVLTLLVSLLYHYYDRPIEHWSGWFFFSGLFLTIFLTYVIFREYAKDWKRYRYIYAIEQFKQYFANEHWIALGDDIFENHENPYFRELKRQCVKNGVGLLSVDRDFRVHPVVTPSREIVLKQRKRYLNILPGKDIQKHAGRLFSKMKIPARWSFFRNRSTINYSRFQKQPYRQFIVLFVCWSVISGLIWSELSDPKIVYEAEEEYEEQLITEIPELFPETEEYVFDSVVTNPFKNSLIFYIIAPPSNYNTLKREGWLKRSVKRKDKRIYFSRAGFEVTWHRCEKFKVFKERHYFITYQRTNELGKAFQITERLRQQGLPANFFWEGCFDMGSNYRIFLDIFFETKEEADFRKQQIQKILKGKENLAKFVTVNSIYFNR